MSTPNLSLSEILNQQIDATGAEAGAQILFFRLKARVGAYVAECIRRRAIRRAEAQLRGLDDRMLRDIGLTRSEIHVAVRSTEQEFLLMPQPR